MTRKNGYIVFIALMLVLAALLAGCRGTGTEAGPVALEYSFEEGDSYAYDVSIDVTGEMTGEGEMAGGQAIPHNADLDARIHIEVVEIDDEGNTTLEYSLEDLTIETEERQMPSPSTHEETHTVTIDEDGRVVSVDGKLRDATEMDGAMPEGFDMDRFPFDPSAFAPEADFMFPEGGVADEGDEWEGTVTYPLPFLNQEVTASSRGELASIKTVDGREVATIDYEVEIPMDLTIDYGQILSGMGFDQMMSGTSAEELEGMQGFEDMELDMPSATMALTGSQSMVATAAVYTDTGFPATLDADVVVDLTVDVTDASEDAADTPREPVTIDYTVHVELKQVP